jgi:hypothetical protein
LTHVINDGLFGTDACVIGIKGHGVTALPSLLTAWLSQALGCS